MLVACCPQYNAYFCRCRGLMTRQCAELRHGHCQPIFFVGSDVSAFAGRVYALRSLGCGEEAPKRHCGRGMDRVYLNEPIAQQGLMLSGIPTDPVARQGVLSRAGHMLLPQPRPAVGGHPPVKGVCARLLLM